MSAFSLFSQGWSFGWSCGREAEGGGLLNRYRVVKPYRGFESLRLRHPLIACASALASHDEAKRRRGATPKLRSRDGDLLALTGYNGKPSAMAGRRLDRIDAPPQQTHLSCLLH